MTQTEYDFGDHAAILKEIDALPDDDKAAYNEKMDRLEPAARAFLRTRTNSELMDIADLEPSIWDYMGSFCDWYKEERGRRTWPESTEVVDLIDDWHEESAGKDSMRARFFELEKQVAGMQKKVDRIASLLKDAKFTISGETALKL